MFRTRCLSLVYCVNLAGTSHTHQSTVNVCLKVIEKCTNFYFRTEKLPPKF